MTEALVAGELREGCRYRCETNGRVERMARGTLGEGRVGGKMPMRGLQGTGRAWIGVAATLLALPLTTTTGAACGEVFR